MRKSPAKMSAIDSFSGVDITGVGVEGGGVAVGVEGGGVAVGFDGSGDGVGQRRRRRSRSNRRRRIPLEITSQAAFNDYINSLAFNSYDDYSPVHFDSSMGSWRIYSYNHTYSLPISEQVDLESGEMEAKVHASKINGNQCRICHLKFEGGGDGDNDDEVAAEEDSGEAMELGCDCKGDLGTAHQKCALTWFLIKGDLICEICGGIVQNLCALAQNVDFGAIEEMNDDDDTEVQPPESSVAEPLAEADEGESSMHGRRVVNVLLGCLALAFVLSWLFHFNMLH